MVSAFLPRVCPTKSTPHPPSQNTVYYRVQRVRIGTSQFVTRVCGGGLLFFHNSMAASLVPLDPNCNYDNQVAMVGKDCVAIAADRRFGVQGQTIGLDFQKIFPMADKLYIGLAGLATDVQTL